MKVIQRIPRTLVRAVSAGAVMVAAALPLAAAGVAGAATPASLSASSLSATSTNQGVTAVFATGANYATSVVPFNGFAFTTGTAQGFTDATTSGNLASGTTLTQYSQSTLSGSTTADASPSTTVTLSAALAASTTIYAGASITIANGSNSAAYTVAATVTAGATSLTTTSAVAAADTGGTYSVASGLVYDFNSGHTPLANSAVAPGDTLFTSPVTFASSAYVTAGQGAGPETVYVFGSGFAYDGGNVSVTAYPYGSTTAATGITFSGAAETNLVTNSSAANYGYGYVSASLTVNSTVTPGYYDLVVTDNNGATAPLVPGLLVTAAPTVTSISPTTISTGGSFQTVTLTGTNFAANMTVTFTNTSDGTTLQDNATLHTNNGTANVTSATSATIPVYPTNSVTDGTASAGTYAITVTNTDMGTSTTATGLLTLTGPTITAVTPSFLPVSATASSTTNVTITGTDLVTYAVVTTGDSQLVLGAPIYTSSTSITVPVTVPAGATTGAYSVTVTNPGTAGAATVAGALGIGAAPTAAESAPTITGASNFTVAPGTTGTLVLTGTNFVPVGTAYVTFYQGTSSTVESALTCTAGGSNDVVVDSTTQLHCAITVANGAGSSAPTLFGGPASATVDFVSSSDTTAMSNQFANALTVAGPTITSISPAVYAANASMGTVTITGTGFTSAASYDFVATGVTGAAVTGSNSTGTPAVVTYVSATELQVSGLTAGAASVNDTMTLTQGNVSAQGAFSIGGNPIVTGVSYASSSITGVGVGATNAAVKVSGSGFLPGATVAFNSALVTDTVTSVTYNAIVLSVSVSSSAVPTGVTGATDPTFVVSNTNGGSVTSSITIDAAPLSGATISATSVIAGAPAATITVTGGNMSAGTTVASSSTLLTLGTPSYSTATGTYSFTASGPAITGTTAVGLSLTFTNPDGGVSTQPFAINPEPTVTGTYYVPTFSTNLEVPVTGSGFEQNLTASSSNSAYTVYVAGVNGTGTVVTLLVTTSSAATSGTSSNVTLTNPDGSTVTFALNGGPAPTSTKTAVAFRAIRVVGAAFVGKTVDVGITGTGFYGAPTIRSNSAGVRAWATHDNGHLLTVRVVVAKNAPRGVHVFTITLKNGKRTTVKYNQR